MAAEQIFQVPINLNLQELRNGVLQVLATAPASKLGRIYYDSAVDSAGHFNSLGVFVPWDAAKRTNIPNSALTNSSVIVGTTTISLGATVTSLLGLAGVTATTFTGALAGNATTATTLATARTISLSGITGTATSFDGSANIVIPVTAVPTTLLAGILAAGQFPALSGDVTTAAGTLGTTIANGVVTNAKLANSALTIGTTAISLGATTTTLAGLTSVASTTFTGALTGNATTATTLATARTITLAGGATAAATGFDGSANITLSITALDASVLTGTTTAAHISDLATTVKAYPLNTFAAPSGNVSLNGYLINNVGQAVAGTDAVNLNQLNAAVSTGSAGLTPHNSVRLVTRAPISTLSGLLTIDTVTTVAGDRVLVKDHTNPALNGIYVAATGSWALAADSTQGRMVTGSMMLVTEGSSTSVGSQWWLTTSGPITIGTTALTFSEYGLNDGRIFGNGLTSSGATVSVVPSTGILVSGAGVAVDTSVVVRKAVATIGDGTATSFAITHTLNTTAVTVAAMNISTGNLETVGITVTSASVVTITFGTAPAANSYQIVIHG